MDRFWNKIRKTEGCWLFVGATDRGGYGRFELDGKNRLAHHISWYIHTGAFPKDKLLHTCDVRNCCNPGHLFEGNQADNVRDMVRKGRVQHKLSLGQIKDILDSPKESSTVLAKKHRISRRMVRLLRSGYVHRRYERVLT